MFIVTLVSEVQLNDGRKRVSVTATQAVFRKKKVKGTIC